MIWVNALESDGDGGRRWSGTVRVGLGQGAPIVVRWHSGPFGAMLRIDRSLRARDTPPSDVGLPILR